MELMEAIYQRRSIRKYKDDPVPKEVVGRLLEAATLAPSASNSQPWAFAVIQDRDRLLGYSDRAKALFLEWFKNQADPQGYLALLSKPDFNIFYDAGTLVIIYSRYGNVSPMALGDCCLAAENLMLAAHGLGLGSCWIGFATLLVNDPAFKEELGIPQDYQAVAPLILGYPEAVPSGYSRKPPEVLVWE
ncbi:nitroreductase [Hydrogenispora ethanolica]|jgi:nitroreductase|uniref:Nitroreductase n=1 Tax=Hydrogenispora ethanolica TaxID=1082276 RepID=A0A4R1SA60_HYDET|nr:nitroreductase family protein [Hydrogenispora ethanolica]TCL76386.1 nitroreductase [Hydrogenispora ethanolica]